MRNFRTEQFQKRPGEKRSEVTRPASRTALSPRSAEIHMGRVSLFSTEESSDQVNYFSKRIFSLIAFVKEELDTDVVEGNKAGSIF